LTLLQQVPISPQPPSRFKAVLTDAQYSDLVATIERARGVIDAGVIWNVNSTARGGGVAELLQSLVGYARASIVAGASSPASRTSSR
jgi:trehalose synthase